MEILILVFQAVILTYFLFLNGFYTFFTLISLVQVRNYYSRVTFQDIRSHLSPSYYRPITIVVPAYNEESTIINNLKSLLSLKYPQYEVVVVDDGSTDGTLQRLKKEFRLVETQKPIKLVISHKAIKKVYLSLDFGHLIVVHKENGGKTDALNAGINASSYPLFCSIDADSILDKEGLLRAARQFVIDKRVISTGGIIRVLNGSKVEKGEIVDYHPPRRMVENFQVVEYIRGFLSGRTAWNYLGSLLIISGTFALFRKDLAIAVGGYRETVGEDMDLIVRFHKYCRENHIPYRILFVPDPVCYTQVPSDFKSLWKQRNRWQRGLVDSLYFSRKMFLNPRYGTVGLFGVPYFLFVETLGPMVELLGYVGFLLFLVFGVLNWTFALLFFVVAILWAMWINIGSILVDELLYKRYKRFRDVMKLCVFGLIEMLGYRQMISFFRFWASFQFRRKKWGKAKRGQI
ncbi:glycosyltransferase family 2 protein [bacterium]|nr:glycosyltransferase family 2 protein [bacterium]